MKEIPFEPFPELCTILPLTPLRKTEGVTFDSLPLDLLAECEGAERVIHTQGAVSPGPVEGTSRPWYCHKGQDDHLLVLAGSREVELYHPGYGKVVRFRVTPDAIYSDDQMLWNGGAVLRWKAGVFHRIQSSPVVGSSSINFAKRYESFDIKHEFDIYALAVETGRFKVIRDGFLDQYDMSE